MHALLAASLHSCGLTHRELFLLSNVLPDTIEGIENITAPLLQSAGISAEKAQKVAQKALNFPSARMEKILAEKQIHLVLSSDSDYPSLLKGMTSFPFLLYVR